MLDGVLEVTRFCLLTCESQAVAFLRGSASRRMAARILLGWLGWAAVASAAKRLSARSGELPAGAGGVCACVVEFLLGAPG